MSKNKNKKREKRSQNNSNQIQDRVTQSKRLLLKQHRLPCKRPHCFYVSTLEGSRGAQRASPYVGEQLITRHASVLPALPAKRCLRFTYRCWTFSLFSSLPHASLLIFPFLLFCCFFIWVIVLRATVIRFIPLMKFAALIIGEALHAAVRYCRQLHISSSPGETPLSILAFII